MLQKIKAFFADRKAAKIEKSAKLLKNPKAMREDRWAAIEYLCGLDDVEKGIPALLQRFEYSLEHGINDTREKELALSGIVKYAELGLPTLRTHLSQTTRIAWPIKALKAVASEDVVIEVLSSALNYGEIAFDQQAVDKNYDVLCYLRDYKLKGMGQRLSHFLKDQDERVRFAACELIIEQEDSGIAEMVEPFLVDSSAENRRLRQAVQQAFTAHGWQIKDPAIAQALSPTPRA